VGTEQVWLPRDALFTHLLSPRVIAHRDRVRQLARFGEVHCGFRPGIAGEENTSRASFGDQLALVVTEGGTEPATFKIEEELRAD
jgi:hypothetical protein